MVVETMRIGNTTVEICDDYIVKTPEEVEAILNRIAQIYLQSIVRKNVG